MYFYSILNKTAH